MCWGCNEVRGFEGAVGLPMQLALLTHAGKFRTKVHGPPQSFYIE
jgi:hypothetical protein